MKYHYKEARTKGRRAAIISLAEVNDDKLRAKELVTELAMITGYVGFLDNPGEDMRIYFFTDEDSADQLVKEARKMKFRTAGHYTDWIWIKNTELQRPHLQYMPKERFYKELYK